MMFTPSRYCQQWRQRAGLAASTGPETCTECPHAAAGCPFRGCGPGAVRVDAVMGGPGGRAAIPRGILEGICDQARRGEGLPPATEDENCLHCLAFLPCEQLQRAAAAGVRCLLDDLEEPAEEWEAPALRQAREICEDTRRAAGLPEVDPGDCRQCSAADRCELG